MPLIILDRDGVINQDSPHYIKTPAEWHPLPGSLAAIARLNNAGYPVAVATNQSGVGRAYYSLASLAAIHDKMHQALARHGGQLAMVAVCPHQPADGCDCRKPKPGLLYQITSALQTALAEAVMIGDSLRDVQAAQAAGMRAILVLTGNGAETQANHADKLSGVAVYEDLAAAVTAILNE